MFNFAVYANIALQSGVETLVVHCDNGTICCFVYMNLVATVSESFRSE
jgi:hypothetical protein